MPSRVSIRREAGGTEVRVAAPRSWTMIVFLLFWMIGWAGGEVAAWRMVSTTDIPPSAYAYVGAWILLWTLGGVAGAVGLLWALAGHETVAVRGDTLTLRRAAGPLGKRWSFPRAGVRDLRYVPPHSGDRRSRAGPGMVGFEHGKRSIRFGAYLGADDARAVVDALAPLVAGGDRGGGPR
jgi:hypothetical protein